MDDLIEHLVENHNQSISVTTKDFPNLHSFMQWKEEMELKSSSLFVLHSSPKQRVDYTCYYYYCNRTGQYNSKGKSKRNLKIQGTSKIGCHCTAYKSTEYLSGEVFAEICNHHTHPIELGHLKLSDSVRQMIAAKLSDGVTISAILDSVRDSVEKIDRNSLLCRICQIMTSLLESKPASFQRDMLVQFGPTAICMDSTHSTNAYDMISFL